MGAPADGAPGRGTRVLGRHLQRLRRERRRNGHRILRTGRPRDADGAREVDRVRPGDRARRVRHGNRRRDDLLVDAAVGGTPAGGEARADADHVDRLRTDRGGRLLRADRRHAPGLPDLRRLTMRFTTGAASSLASTLPSLRVVLLFGGVLALSESIVLATTLFAGAFVSFAAGLVIATTIYRSAAPRDTDEQDDAAAATIAAAGEPSRLRHAA